jgi:hypothetical protein
MPAAQRAKISAGVKAKAAAKAAAEGAELDAEALRDVARDPDPPPGAFPGGPQRKLFDPPPVAPKDKKGRRGRERAARARTGKPATDSELVGTLARMLSMPAIPAKMVLDCDFCAEHFAVEGPKTARELVTLSADHPDLRGVLEDMHRAYTSVTWLGIVAGYLAKPMLHHLAPAPLLEATFPIVGVPPSAPAGARPRPAAAPAAASSMPPGMGGMFDAEAMAQAQAMMDGMSEEDVMNLARQFGLDAMIPGDPHGSSDPSTDPPESDPGSDPGPEPDPDPDAG